MSLLAIFSVILRNRDIKLNKYGALVFLRTIETGTGSQRFVSDVQADVRRHLDFRPIQSLAPGLVYKILQQYLLKEELIVIPET